jgi:hypothetical protein
LQLIKPGGEVPVKAKPGDKVRLKAGKYRGERGIVRGVDGGKVVVHLADAEVLVRATPSDLTNFSLAARKAWVTLPDRAVGRRKGTRLTDRVSVTLRLDRELWERFQSLEDATIIGDRTATINRWFREKLDHLDAEGTTS